MRGRDKREKREKSEGNAEVLCNFCQLWAPFGVLLSTYGEMCWMA